MHLSNLVLNISSVFFPSVYSLHCFVFLLPLVFLHHCLLSVRGPEAALLRLLRTHAPRYPHSVHQPLPGFGHHFHHLHQRHHHVSGALQPATGDHLEIAGESGVGVGDGAFQTKQSGRLV